MSAMKDAIVSSSLIPPDPPLVVDLDGTLTPTDTLVESLITLAKQAPRQLLRLPWWLLQGRADFKAAIAAHVGIAAEHLPYREAFLNYLRDEKNKGRKLILATAADASIAQAVHAHLGLFDAVIASTAGHNLKGQHKLEAIRQTLGDEFVYAGDSHADTPIWKAAKKAVLVGVPAKVAETIRREVPIEREFPRENPGIAAWLRLLRVHQWLKNLLLLVPLFTAFSFTDVDKLSVVAIAFLSFSVAASATYMLNDLWDLDHDRAHPRKRLRPFASATLPILPGLVVALGLLLLGFILAGFISQDFATLLLLYVVLTSAYSGFLKQYVLVDVLILAILYTLRIVAGSVVTGIAISSWLLAFSVFIFLSLALVKRCAELVSLQQQGLTATRGRDYRVSDLVVLWPLGVGAALCAVVVFGLFISAPDTQVRYATPHLLWLVALGLIYWLARLWIKTARSEMHDDPVIYAIRNHGSRITIFVMLLAMLAAHFLSWPNL